MLVILFSLKTMESLKNGLQSHSEVTSLFSMTAVSLASLWSCRSIDADIWCKRALKARGDGDNKLISRSEILMHGSQGSIEKRRIPVLVTVGSTNPRPMMSIINDSSRCIRVSYLSINYIRTCKCYEREIRPETINNEIGNRFGCFG